MRQYGRQLTETTRKYEISGVAERTSDRVASGVGIDVTLLCLALDDAGSDFLSRDGNPSGPVVSRPRPPSHTRQHRRDHGEREDGRLREEFEEFARGALSAPGDWPHDVAFAVMDHKGRRGLVIPDFGASKCPRP